MTPARVNYVYFGFFFLVLFILHTFHVLIIEDQSSFSRYYFLVYSTAQCLIELLFLIILGGLISSYLPPLAMGIFITVTFVVFITHLIDFPLVRLMDMSFWTALAFMSHESWENFIEILYSTNVSMVIWLIAGILALLGIFFGLVLYAMTDRFSLRKPLTLPHASLMVVFVSLLFFLITWDLTSAKYTASTLFDRYQKTLPWKTTFFPPHRQYLKLKSALGKLPDSERILNEWNYPLKKQPDIFLFVVESLRADYINETNTPYLDSFKKAHISFDRSTASANATQSSWFSLFTANHPLYWDQTHLPRSGTLPLQLLKKMGYQIHVYSSSRLNFYKMDQILFGKNHELTNSLSTFFDEPIHLRDKKAIEEMLSEAQKQSSSGRLFIVFIESTHFDYSWPDQERPRFQPIEPKINYLQAACSVSCLEKIKNRYRNSLNYIDSLFEKFVTTLNQTARGNESVIIFLGDHGEEFYEKGHIFHASHLSSEQVEIPIFYRFGTSACPHHKELTTHIDVFPSLFHHLIGKELPQGIFNGESIFTKTPWPYTLSARYSATRPPADFCLSDEKNKITFSFRDASRIDRCRTLRVLSTSDLSDRHIPLNLSQITEEFNEAFNRLFTQTSE